MPLSDLAMELIEEAMRKTNGDILFPNRAGDAAIKHRAIDCALRLAQTPRKGLPLGKFGIPVWKPHDLRRTGGTHLSLRENGLMVSVMDRAHVLNHRSVTRGSITDTAYNLNEFELEKRDVLEKWARFLGELIKREMDQRQGTATAVSGQ